MVILLTYLEELLPIYQYIHDPLIVLSCEFFTNIMKLMYSAIESETIIASTPVPSLSVNIAQA